MAHHILAARQTVVMPITPHHISWIRPQYRHSPIHSHHTLASGSPPHRPRHRLREALEEGQTDDTTIVRPAPVSACSTTRTRSCHSVSFLSCYARRLKAASTDALSSYEQCNPPILSLDHHPSTARFKSLLSRDGTTTLRCAIVRSANAETTPTRAVVGCRKVFRASQWYRRAYWYAGIVFICDEGRMRVRRLCVDAHARPAPLSFPNYCEQDSDCHALIICRHATSLANCTHDTQWTQSPQYISTVTANSAETSQKSGTGRCKSAERRAVTNIFTANRRLSKRDESTGCRPLSEKP